jgi:hypothetical protein
LGIVVVPVRRVKRRKSLALEPRPPAPVASSSGAPITAEMFFAGCALIGVLNAQLQHGEVNKKWACKWSRTMGALMMGAFAPRARARTRRR